MKFSSLSLTILFGMVGLLVLTACGTRDSSFTPTPTQTVIFRSLTSTPIPSSTPTPIPSLAAAHDVLNWHIQFESDRQTQVLRCTRIVELTPEATMDSVSENLVSRDIFEPLTVSLRGTLISPQILAEAYVILKDANPSLASHLNDWIENPNYLMFLFTLEFDGERDLYQLRELEPDFAISLNRLEFEFAEDSRGQRAPSLILSETTRFIPFEVSEEIFRAGTTYLILFNLPVTTTEELLSLGNSGVLIIETNLILLDPFPLPRCESEGNLTGDFVLTLPLSSGNSREMFSLYGDIIEVLSNEQIDSLRFELLTDFLLREIPTTEVNSSETTPEATEANSSETTPEATGESD